MVILKSVPSYRKVELVPRSIQPEYVPRRVLVLPGQPYCHGLLIPHQDGILNDGVAYEKLLAPVMDRVLTGEKSLVRLAFVSHFPLV
jgi:hypothetical protein